MAQKKVVDARADDKGNITDVLLQGNSRFTPKEIAIGMADRGELANVHVVRPAGRDPYLRTNPDQSKRNNLDDMAGDK